MPSYDSDHWDWGGGFCRIHRGQGVPCPVCLDDPTADVRRVDERQALERGFNAIVDNLPAVMEATGWPNAAEILEGRKPSAADEPVCMGVDLAVPGKDATVRIVGGPIPAELTRETLESLPPADPRREVVPKFGGGDRIAMKGSRRHGVIISQLSPEIAPHRMFAWYRIRLDNDPRVYDVGEDELVPGYLEPVPMAADKAVIHYATATKMGMVGPSGAIETTVDEVLAGLALRRAVDKRLDHFRQHLKDLNWELLNGLECRGAIQREERETRFMIRELEGLLEAELP